MTPERPWDVCPSCCREQHERCQGSCDCCQPDLTFAAAQKAAWANKLAHGFSTGNVPLEFCLLTTEVGEAIDAWRHGQADLLPGELADVAIFLLGVAEMTGVDLQAAVEAKLAVNAARAYTALPNGCHVKQDAP
jgi:hypothetical protein